MAREAGKALCAAEAACVRSLVSASLAGCDVPRFGWKNLGDSCLRADWTPAFLLMRSRPLATPAPFVWRSRVGRLQQQVGVEDRRDSRIGAFHVPPA